MAEIVEDVKKIANLNWNKSLYDELFLFFFMTKRSHFLPYFFHIETAVILKARASSV